VTGPASETTAGPVLDADQLARLPRRHVAVSEQATADYLAHAAAGRRS